MVLLPVSPHFPIEIPHFPTAGAAHRLRAIRQLQGAAGAASHPAPGLARFTVGEVQDMKGKKRKNMGIYGNYILNIWEYMKIIIIEYQDMNIWSDSMGIRN